jgi:putative cardiolipin synthase
LFLPFCSSNKKTAMLARIAKLYSVMMAGARFAALLLVVLAASCASLPTDYEKVPSTAIRDTGTTQLGQKARPLAAAHPGESGFYPLSDGVEALGARLLLTQRAEASIDVQYYYILPDITGNLLLGQLLKAANRGVRVRILIDDIDTKGYEQIFAVLSAKSNIEVRLANPFASRRARGLNMLSDFQRLNHRMHNKSMTFDNAVTIVGGRNIAVEYFGAGDVFNYGDLDVLGIGPVADQVSTEFDTYWNASTTLPVTAFVEPDDSAESFEELKDKFAATVEEAKSTPYSDALRSSIGDLVFSHEHSPLVWSPAQVVYDLPYGQTTAGDEIGTEVLAGILLNAVDQVVEELVVISPYFVPGDSGVERFRQLRERGVRCVILTNSLASTDVPAVYGGYKDYHVALLELGVELWELMAYPDKPGNERGSSNERKSLHAKTFAVDRRQLFVGSFNWDARSRSINTEMGLLIESPVLAARLAESLQATLPGSAWQVRLSDKGKVEWVGVQDGKEIVYTKAPQTSVWRRFGARITGLDAIEGQL